MAPDATLSTLAQIRTKIRRLTRSPSASQLTDAQIDAYVNTFVLYDFPEFTVDNKLVFFLSPNVDVYPTNTVNADDPLYNFKNIYESVHGPAYVMGNQIEFSQSRDYFYRVYPKVQVEKTVDTGDGVTVLFAGTLSNIPVLANSVTFSSIDANGSAIVLKDLPEYDVTTGIQLQTGDLVEPDAVASVGTINYLTGVYSLTFPVAPGNGESVVAQGYAYSAGIPKSVMYENNVFTFRPVPDKTYRVEIDAFKRPTELLNAADQPDLGRGRLCYSVLPSSNLVREQQRFTAVVMLALLI